MFDGDAYLAVFRLPYGGDPRRELSGRPEDGVCSRGFMTQTQTWALLRFLPWGGGQKGGRLPVAALRAFLAGRVPRRRGDTFLVLRRVGSVQGSAGLAVVDPRGGLRVVPRFVEPLVWSYARGDAYTSLLHSLSRVLSGRAFSLVLLDFLEAAVGAELDTESHALLALARAYLQGRRTALDVRAALPQGVGEPEKELVLEAGALAKRTIESVVLHLSAVSKHELSAPGLFLPLPGELEFHESLRLLGGVTLGAPPRWFPSGALAPLFAGWPSEPAVVLSLNRTLARVFPLGKALLSCLEDSKA